MGNYIMVYFKLIRYIKFVVSKYKRKFSRPIFLNNIKRKSFQCFFFMILERFKWGSTHKSIKINLEHLDS